MVSMVKAVGKRRGVNKSAKIREVLEATGVDTRTRDVITTLKTRKIKVSSAQVSNIKAAMRKKSDGVVSGEMDVVSLSALLQGKRFVSMAGGVDNARRILDAILQLG
jgi:hypothetical protein